MNFSLKRAALLSATAIASITALPALAQEAPQADAADEPGTEIGRLERPIRRSGGPSLETRRQIHGSTRLFSTGPDRRLCSVSTADPAATRFSPAFRA